MIKIRNKRIALLLVLAMLATMVVGVGTASAASNYVQADSTWTFVDAGENNQDAGDLTIKTKDAWPTVPNAVNSVGVVVTLKTAGVNFSATNSDEWSKLGLITPAEINAGYVLYGNNELQLDVDDSVTGAITVDVRVYGKYIDGDPTTEDPYIFDETETQTIAKVDAGTTVVSVGAKKTVQSGEDNQVGSRITIKETGPSAFDVSGQEVTFALVTSGVEFDNWGFVVFDGTNNPGYVTAPTSENLNDSNKKITAKFNTNDVSAERIALDYTLDVAPSVKDGTEVKVKVSGDNIVTTTVVVAVVGSTDIQVKVTDADKDFVYRGQAATLDDVAVKLNPGGKLDSEWDEQDWFSITLPEGLKWQYNPVDVDDPSIAFFDDFEDNGQTIWFNVDDWSDQNLKLTNFAVVADANAVVGDLNVKFDGCVEGTYKIGSIKNAFTIETVPFALTSGATDIQGAKIIIKETADGALVPTWDGDAEDADYNYVDYKGDYHSYDPFDIELPAGISLVGNAEIDVTEGDIDVDWSSDDSEDYRTLYFDIDDVSSEASTIEISGLEYSVLSQPGLGDLKALVGQGYNIASNKALESLVVGSIATNPTAVYVIGASTFTVNGVSQSVVAPSYVKNNRTYLAIRDIATGLGIDPVNVLWDAAGQKVTLIKGAKIVQVAIGSNTMLVNGVPVAMDVAPEYGPSDRSFLPAAFIAQAFGATASWDGLTQTVTIK